MTSPVLLALAYALIGALLLLCCTTTTLPRWVKGTLIMVVSGFYGLTWYGYREALGWPTPVNMPAEFRVLWITIDEPAKTSNEPGAIFFWIRPLDSAGIPHGRPRAHSIAWNQDALEAANEALDKLQEGELINGRMSRNLLHEEPNNQSDDSDYEAGQIPAAEDGLAPTFEFTEVAPPTLPAKSSNL